MASTNVVEKPRRKYTKRNKKFSQSYPCTTIYWHRCKFTGKLFASPVRRLTYSPEGERLKKEQDKVIYAARKVSSRVYFYCCPETKQWFTTRIPNDRYSEEGKRIMKERRTNYLAEYHQREDVKQRERNRNASDHKQGYLKQWHERNQDKTRVYLERQKERYHRTKKKKEVLDCPVYFNVCKVTGKLFTAQRRSKQYSPEGVKVKMQEYYQKSLATQRVKYKAKVEGKPRVVKCAYCQKETVIPFGVKLKKHCSVECAMKAERLSKADRKTHRKRAMLFGCEYESVSLRKVFFRDKWTCKLCGCSTPKSLRGTKNDNAPEIDHIIPLSKGGPHKEHNLQCVCRSCNNKKGNKEIGQLRLAI